MRLIIDTTRVWVRLAEFCYKRAWAVEKHEPDGIPGRRSAEAPCTGFDPRKKRFGDWDACDTDGHYLCYECCHRKPVEAEKGEQQ